jgi:hypothetical protein
LAAAFQPNGRGGFPRRLEADEEKDMTLTKISGAAGALSLGLLLFAVQTAAADRPAREAAVAMRGAASPSAADSPRATAMEEFLQCRVGCAPRCEGTGNAEQTERCKQRCEMNCNAADAE